MYHWRGGRVLLLPNGYVVKPLQEESERGQRVLIGEFDGPVALRTPAGIVFDLNNPGRLAPGSPWLGPSTTGLECVMKGDGSLECKWYHPTGYGSETMRRTLTRSDHRLAQGFRSARPGDTVGRVRITANGHVITNFNTGVGWVPRYVGRVEPAGWLRGALDNVHEVASASTAPRPDAGGASSTSTPDPEHTVLREPGKKKPPLYPGLWPVKPGRVARYCVSLVDGVWRVTLSLRDSEGQTLLPVEGAYDDLPERVNHIRTELGAPPGGEFFINEFHHIVVPVPNVQDPVGLSRFYCAGRFGGFLKFKYRDKWLTGKPEHADGRELYQGDRWNGPRPGVPYLLASDRDDVYYEIADGSPQARGMNRSPMITALGGHRGEYAARGVVRQQKSRRGRFYVNEYGAMFTPVGGGEGNGIDYVYCGQVDPRYWFPMPAVSS